MARNEDPSNETVRLSRDGDVIRVDFTDREFTSNAYIADLRAKIDHVVETVPNPQVTLNFATVDHLSSAAIGELIRAHRSIDRAGGKLIISEPKPSVMAIFEVTRINQTLHIRAAGA